MTGQGIKDSLVLAWITIQYQRLRLERLEEEQVDEIRNKELGFVHVNFEMSLGSYMLIFSKKLDKWV